jgi:large subunit ribosomal protein L25
MSSIKLEAKRREVLGKQVRALRRQGMIPAVIYGAGLEPLSIELEAVEASKTLGRATSATLVEVVVGDETHTSLVREVQRDPVQRNILHVDLLKVAMDQLIRAEVPLDVIGEAPAVKTLGGILVPGIDQVEVEALPADLPDRIVVDLSVLTKIDDSITVASITLKPGVRMLTDSDEVVARVIYQAEEIIEAPVEAVPTTTEPEVIAKAKKEEEEEEGKSASD